MTTRSSTENGLDSARSGFRKAVTRATVAADNQRKTIVQRIMILQIKGPAGPNRSRKPGRQPYQAHWLGVHHAEDRIGS